MALILVAGGTGQAGRAVVAEALTRGFSVRSASRLLPAPGAAAALDGVEYLSADVSAGTGLAAALDGVDVVIDVLEARSGKALKLSSRTAARLLSSARGSGTTHAVSLSIARCDQLDLAYYRAKVEKERVYREDALSTTVVRASQFHTLLGGLFSAGRRLGVVPSIKHARLQPIDVADAAALVDAAQRALEPSVSDHSLVTVSGPETLPLRVFAEQWRTARGGRGRILDIPLPGGPGRCFREGRNLEPGSSYGRTTFAEWLSSTS